MEWIEVTGRTLESAREVALDRLGVAEADLDYEVLEEPKGGFLGMGRADARIRARVKPLSREKPNDRRRRSRTRSDDRGRGDTSSPRNGDRSAKSKRGRSEGSREGARQKRSSGARADSTARAGSKPKQAKSAEEPAKPGSRGEQNVTEAPMTEAEQLEHADRFLKDLVAAFGLEASCSASFEDERLRASIDGSGLGHLIGPNGATLAAIEELTQTMLQHASDGHGPRVRLDVGGYRAERQAALEAFTGELADRVRSSGRDVALEPMGSTDRKIVHDIIAECDDLETISEGEEPERRVVIRALS